MTSNDLLPSEATCVVSAAEQAELGPVKCPAGEAGAAAVDARPEGDAPEPKEEEEKAASDENNTTTTPSNDDGDAAANPSPQPHHWLETARRGESSPPPPPRVGPRFQAEVPAAPLGSPPATAEEAKDPRAAMPGPSPRTAVALAAGHHGGGAVLGGVSEDVVAGEIEDL